MSQERNSRRTTDNVVYSLSSCDGEGISVLHCPITGTESSGQNPIFFFFFKFVKVSTRLLD